MDRRTLQWIGGILVFVLVAPILFYLVTGSVLGFLLPCGSEAPLEVFAYDGSTLEVPCAALGTAIKLGVSIWGTTLVGTVVFLIGFADLFRSEPSPGRGRP